MHWFVHSSIHLFKDLLTASSLPHLTPAYHSGKPLTSETRLGPHVIPSWGTSYFPFRRTSALGSSGLNTCFLHLTIMSIRVGSTPVFFFFASVSQHQTPRSCSVNPHVCVRHGGVRARLAGSLCRPQGACSNIRNQHLKAAASEAAERCNELICWIAVYPCSSPDPRCNLKRTKGPRFKLKRYSSEDAWAT